MHNNGFAVQVTRPDGTPFHEVQATDGTRYVVAAAGEPFEVVVSRDDQLGDGYEHYLYKCHLKIDGKSVGVSQILPRPASIVKFVGFVRQGNTDAITYDLFAFAAAPEDGTVQTNSLDFEQGKLELKIWEARQSHTETNTYSHHGSSSTHNASAVPSLPEGKKFFMKPSLTTGSAGCSTSGGFSKTVYNTVGHEPIATMMLQYETPTTLMLRKILRNDIPAHAAILNSFPETRAGGAGGGASGSRVKRERTGDSDEAHLNVKPEVIDLVGRPAARPVERLAADEELVCDLTGGGSDGDDGEGGSEPKWVKRRKAPVEPDAVIQL